MLSKEEIETCKEEARNYIEFMETAGDNACWTRGLMWYIDKLEKKLKELGKGQQSLMQSRKKWKNRYYKMRKTNKKLESENYEQNNIINNYIETFNKLKWKMTGDKMEQFDDYVIYLIETYLEILKGEKL